MNKEVYIIVVFLDGIGCTLQTDNKAHVFFSRNAKTYKRLGCAIKRACKLSSKYLNDTVCVFKVSEGERLSSDQYKEWKKDKERLMWNAEQWY